MLRFFCIKNKLKYHNIFYDNSLIAWYLMFSNLLKQTKGRFVMTLMTNSYNSENEESKISLGKVFDLHRIQLNDTHQNRSSVTDHLYTLVSFNKSPPPSYFTWTLILTKCMYSCGKSDTGCKTRLLKSSCFREKKLFKNLKLLKTFWPSCQDGVSRNMPFMKELDGRKTRGDTPGGFNAHWLHGSALWLG